VNSTLTLVRYARLENGWRRGKIVKLPNGKIKHPFMMIGRQETEAPQGRYQMLRYEGSRPVYEDLGNDPTQALSRFKAAEAKAGKRVEAIKAAEAAGLKIEQEQPTSPDPKTLRSLATAFIEKHRDLPHRADDSLDVYTRTTETFLQICNAKYPTQVKAEDITRWAGWLQRECNYSDRTRANRYQALRSFLRYCEINLDKLIDKGAHKLLKAYTKKKPDQYTPEQVDALMKAALDANESFLWDFAYKTGLRESELKMVTRDDLHGLNGKEPMLHVKERDDFGNIKDAEERMSELHPSLVPGLKKWLQDNQTRVLLFGTDSDQPNNKMLKTLKRTARRAGLNCGRCAGCKKKDRECRLFTIHKFRRTYATRMLKATQGDYASVMERTGHSDVETLMRYLAPAESVRMAVNQAF